MGPDPMTGVLIRTGKLDTDSQGEGHVMIEAEIGEMHLPAEEQQDGWQTRSWERGLGQNLLQNLQEDQPNK